MDFHGHKVDVEQAYHTIAMEFARRDLDEYLLERKEYVGPQEKAKIMFDAYFEILGYLFGFDESYIRDLLSRNFPDG